MSGPARPFGVARVRAPTGSRSAEIDRDAIERRGVPQRVLMENAGRSAAALLDHLHPDGPVVALVGKGNNGGDALVALRTLAAWGRDVRAVTVADREDGDELLHGVDVAVDSDEALGTDGLARVLAGASVIVDGILGTGISGAPRERQARAIEAANASGRPVVALDVPSGADADGGRLPGTAIDADVTICFGFPKLGVLLHPARARAGRVVAVEIGFPPPGPDDADPRVVTPGWAAAVRPTREPDTHKNAVGALLVVAGSVGMAGAAVLAARAAMRAGAGLVRIASPGANRAVLQTAAPEAVYVDAHDHDALRAALDASRAVAVGPGLGTDDDARTLLRAVLEGVGDGPLLVDADGLNLLAAGDPPLSAAVEGRPALLTPHPGEMGRLTGRESADVAADRPGAASDFARRHGCTLLLKGTPALVADPGGRLLVDAHASSALATAGMGDVLTGAAGAFLARGLAPREAAGVALATCGRASALAGAGPGLLPTDVAERIPDALVETGPGESDLPLPGLLLDLPAAR